MLQCKDLAPCRDPGFNKLGMVILLGDVEGSAGDEVFMASTWLDDSRGGLVHALNELGEPNDRVNQHLRLTTPDQDVLDGSWKILEPCLLCDSWLLVVVGLRLACHSQLRSWC